MKSGSTPLLEHTLAQPMCGEIGLWSKADSPVYFDDFTVATADWSNSHATE